VNEEAVRVFRLGTNNDALKEKLIMLGDTLSILGVVKNHHWNSLKHVQKPMVFRAAKSADGNVSVRLTGDNQLAIDQIKQTYSASFPGETFSYYFMDDSYNKQYESEQQFGKLFGAFSILAILIGCLGLWGLASFATLHRLKEISIRKVLGASVRSILVLLSSQFLKPLLIGSLIALPLAWWGLSQWLSGFPYRIHLSIEHFLAPLLLLVVIALLTIALQTTKAATSNPVDSLKNE
jgi:putative ABC transport system permease protein